MLVHPDVNLLPNVIWLFFWVSLFGALPAAVFGMIGTCILRKVRKKNRRVNFISNGHDY